MEKNLTIVFILSNYELLFMSAHFLNNLMK